MAPFPGNDHSLQPSAWVDKQYLDYGPLMTAMRGRRWVLEPHVIEVLDSDAKANIFSVSGGFVIPVVFVKKSGTVRVVVNNLNRLAGFKSFIAEAIQPGTGTWVPVKSTGNGQKLTLDVPVQRGCAMVRIRQK